jgi:hypothetical protein
MGNMMNASDTILAIGGTNGTEQDQMSDQTIHLHACLGDCLLAYLLAQMPFSHDDRTVAACLPYFTG